MSSPAVFRQCRTCRHDYVSSTGGRHDCARFRGAIVIKDPAAPTVISDAAGLDPCNGSSFLSVETGGLTMTGVRVPMWPKACDWYEAWEKLVPRFSGDLLVGDLNIDPLRLRRRDQKPLKMLEVDGWRWCQAEGDWSYRSYSGVTSSVDHVFVRGDVDVQSARYLTEGIVGVGPVDHAALVVEAAPRG